MNNLYQAYFLLSENCNLNCKYCFEHKKEKINMNDEVLDKSIKFIKDNKCKSVVLFGGEPTLNSNAVVRCLNELNDINIVLITNCLYVNDEILKSLKDKENVVVQLSIDGNYETMKERVSNKQQFDKIISNLELYKQSVDNEKLYVHMTLTKNNIYSLYENFMFITGLGIKNIQTTFNVNDDFDKFDEQVYKSQLELISDYMLSNNDIFFKPLKPKNNFIGDCKNCGVGNMFVAINAVGDIFPCPRMYSNFGNKYRMGNVYTGIIKIFDFNLNHKESQCNNCKNKICTACPSANIEKYNTIYKTNKGFCKMTDISFDVYNKHKNKIENMKMIKSKNVNHNDINGIKNIQLILTKKCNFNCKYCFSQHSQNDMDFDKIKKLFELIKDKDLSKCNINFFGGEPMLRYNDIILPFVKYANDKKVKLNYSIITNGSLLNDENMDLMIKNNFGIMISLDGTFDTFQKNRNTNKEIYNDILYAINKFTSINYQNFEIRLTYRKDDIKDLFNNVNYIYNLGVKKIQIYHEYDIDLNEEDKIELKKQFEKIFNLYVIHNDLNIFFIDRLLHYFFNNETYNRKILANCGIVNKSNFSFSMDYDGNFYTCHHFNSKSKFSDDFNIGNVNDGFDFEKMKTLEPEKLKESNIDVFNKREEKCKRCQLYNLCSANCIMQNLKLHDNIFINDQVSCDINNIMYNVIQNKLKEI